MKIGIVGAGWAGLSAAVRLKQSGHRVTVFESSDTPGGRARRVTDPKLGNIDNGQHLMLGAYTETLALIQMLHPNLPPDTLLRRSSLKLESLDGQFWMRTGLLPSPLNLLTGMLLAKGLGLSDKWRALVMMFRLKRDAWSCAKEWSVEELLKQHRQTTATCRWLWHPLCIAAMNTPVAEASAQVFLHVLKDSFDGAHNHADLIVPRVDLSALWPDAATTGLDMRWRHVVRRVIVEETSAEIDGESFDYVILATPPYAASRMLAQSIHSDALEALRERLDRFTYVPITNITLGLAEAWKLRGQMWMLDEQVSKGHIGQWVFVNESGKELRVVISAPDERVLDMDHARLASMAYDQVKAQLLRSEHSTNAHKSFMGRLAASPLPVLTHFRVLTEKRATYACTTTLQRPGNQTAWPRLLLAGDWTQSPYPAVLEAAVRSGKRAAELIEQHSTSTQDLMTRLAANPNPEQADQSISLRRAEKLNTPSTVNPSDPSKDVAM